MALRIQAVISTTCDHSSLLLQLHSSLRFTGAGELLCDEAFHLMQKTLCFSAKAVDEDRLSTCCG